MYSDETLKELSKFSNEEELKESDKKKIHKKIKFETLKIIFLHKFIPLLTVYLLFIGSIVQAVYTFSIEPTGKEILFIVVVLILLPLLIEYPLDKRINNKLKEQFSKEDKESIENYINYREEN